MICCERETEDGRKSPQRVVHARLGGIAKQEPAALGGGEEREARGKAVGNRRPHCTPGVGKFRAPDRGSEHDDTGIRRGGVADPQLGAEGG